MKNDVPTIVLEVSEVYIDAWGNGYKNLQDELINNVEIGKLLGYSNWNTVGNSTGIALGMGVARYTYLKYEENISAESHDWHLQSLTYAYVKDISYNARNKLNTWHSYAKSAFHYWLSKHIGWYDNNFWLTNPSIPEADNMDNYDGKADGNATMGRNRLNTALEDFMRGNGSKHLPNAESFDANADTITARLKGDEMYTNLNRAVQTAKIGTITLSNFRFPWDRHFEIYFDVSGSFTSARTYYNKVDTLIHRVPTKQTASDFKAHAAEQYGVSTVVVRNKNGITIGNNDLVGTGYAVTLGSDSTTYAAVVYAETDGDGKITTSDVRQVVQYVLDVETFSAAQKAAADVDGNAKISSTDARRILQLALRQ